MFVYMYYGGGSLVPSRIPTCSYIQYIHTYIEKMRNSKESPVDPILNSRSVQQDLRVPYIHIYVLCMYLCIYLVFIREKHGEFYIPMYI